MSEYCLFRDRYIHRAPDLHKLCEDNEKYFELTFDEVRSPLGQTPHSSAFRRAAERSGINVTVRVRCTFFHGLVCLNAIPEASHIVESGAQVQINCSMMKCMIRFRYIPNGTKNF